MVHQVQKDGRHNGGQQRNNPLNWQEAKVIDVEDVRIVISEAPTQEGHTVRSFTIGRIGREGRTSKFLQPRDKEALEDALDETFDWLEGES